MQVADKSRHSLCMFRVVMPLNRLAINYDFVARD